MSKNHEIKAILNTAMPKIDLEQRTAYPKAQSTSPAHVENGTVIPQASSTTSSATPTSAPPSPKGD